MLEKGGHNIDVFTREQGASYGNSGYKQKNYLSCSFSPVIWEFIILSANIFCLCLADRGCFEKKSVQAG